MHRPHPKPKPRPFIYPVPGFLSGRVTQKQYSRWLEGRGKDLFTRDRQRRKPFALKSSRSLYKSLIHYAVVNAGEFDPFTGDRLSWELIGTWTDVNTEARRPDAYDAKYALMPTVDHKDPDVLEFEICSWKINNAKGNLTPREFIALCKRIARHCSKNTWA
jgi:hypothetical protein